MSKTETEEETKKVDPLHNPEEENIPKAMDDEARRLGDRTVYKYYFQQIGTWNTVIFFGILFIWIVMLKFPGEKSPLDSERVVLFFWFRPLTCSLSQKSGSSGGETQTCEIQAARMANILVSTLSSKFLPSLLLLSTPGRPIFPG